MTYLVTLMPTIALYGFLSGQGLRALAAALLLGPALIPLSQWILRFIRKGLRMPRRQDMNRPMLALWASYLVVTQVALGRAVISGARAPAAGVAEILLFSLIPAAILVSVGAVIRKSGPLQALRGLSVSVVIYIVVNVLGFALGVSNAGVEDNYLRQLESTWSPTGYRLDFPFNLSGRMLSIVAGLTMILLVGMPRFRALPGHVRLLLPAALPCSVVVLAGHGARAPVMATVLMIGLILTTRHHEHLGRFALAAVVAAIICLPYVVLGTSWLEGLGDLSVVSSLGLTREVGDIASLSNRAIIWAAVGAHTLGVAPGILLFGHGGRGHVVSGLSESWSGLFETSYANPYEVSTHSTYAQLLVDSGLVGLGLFLALSWVSMSLLWKSRKAIGDGGAGAFALLFLLLTAGVETSLTYYSIEAWVPFWILVAVSVFLPPSTTHVDPALLSQHARPAEPSASPATDPVEV